MLPERADSLNHKPWKAPCRCGSRNTMYTGIFCVEQFLMCHDCGRRTPLPLSDYEHRVIGERLLLRAGIWL